MCAQTRPRFIFSSDRVLGEWIQNPCYLQGKKSPFTRKNSPKRRMEPRTLHKTGQRAQHTTNAASSRTASPTHYQRCIKQDSQPNTLPTLHQAGQPAQHTTNELFRSPCKRVKDEVSFQLTVKCYIICEKHCSGERFVCWLVGWLVDWLVGGLLNVPATCCISGSDLLRQLYVLPH